MFVSPPSHALVGQLVCFSTHAQLAKPIGHAADGSRPWSKYSVGSSRHAQAAAPAAAAEQPLLAREAKKAARAAKSGVKGPAGAAAGEEDPRLAEFLALMQPRSKQQLWVRAHAACALVLDSLRWWLKLSDVAIQPCGRAQADAADALGANNAAAIPAPGSAAASTRRAVPAGAFADGNADMDEDEDGGDSDSDAVVDDTKHQALNAMSDLEYLRSRTRARISDDDEDGGDGDGKAGPDVDARAKRQVALPEPVDDPPGGLPPPPAAPAVHVGDASDTGRLFIRNLAYTATEEELLALCSPFGDVASVHIPTDRATSACKGLAYVQFTDPGCAATALAGLDKRTFQGRLLHVLPAQRQPGTAAGGEGADASQQGGGYKALKEAQLRASAGDTARHSTWYIRPDTVASALAARYGVSKTDVMEPGSSGVATRLALGEAQIVGDTKAQLTALGCHVATMDAAAASPQGVARSRTALLIKNLPFSAEAEELEELCRRHGRDGLHRLLLPDTKALAVACFIDAQSARAAFSGLAYKRYQHVPLYVEWAPAGLIADATGAAVTAPARAPEAPPAPAAAAKKASGKAAPLSAAEAATEAGGGGDDAEEAALGGPAAQRTLYVKNLAWAPDETGLRAHFLAALPPGSVRSVTVAQRPGKRPGTLVSSGYGFVELGSAEHVATALRSLDGTALDGHALKLQRSRGASAGDDPDAAPGGAAAPRSGGAGTKLVVRNVAFEATKGDIRGLFAPFGQVKSVRLPLKFDGNHRGFAFVEMTTKTEAKAAFAAVGKTHLYGRRLVTEWAVDQDAEDDAAAARDKAARDMATHQAAAGDEAPRKRRKV